MVYDSEIHHRRSIRLKNYDYSQPGAYFITICTHNGTSIFGNVLNDQMCLNDNGEIVQRLWNTLPERFPTVELDFYVVMPNHIHGIVVQAIHQQISSTDNSRMHKQTFKQPTRSELGQIIRTFKAAATCLIRAAGTPEFAWERNYYEHVIRNERDLERIRQYMVDNPACWVEDKLRRGEDMT